MKSGSAPLSLERLLTVLKDLALAQDLQEVAQILKRHVRDLVKCEGFTFVLREGGEVRYLEEDAVGPLWKGRRFPIRSCISGMAMMTRETIIIPDIRRDPRVPIEAYRPTFVKSLAMIPVRLEDPVAAMGVYWARRHRATREEVKLLQTLADAAAGALVNAGLAKKLKESEARFRALVENAWDNVVLVDAAMRILYSNPGSYKSLGLTYDEYIGQAGMGFVHPEDQAGVKETYARILATPGRPHTMRVRRRHKDGSWRWMESVGRNLLDNPAVRAVVVNTRDITERVQLEEELRQTQKMDAVGRLAAGVAHDFNNLLTVIGGQAEILLSQGGLSPAAAARTAEIRDAGEHAALLTRQILSFARPQFMAPRRMDLNGAVRSMEKLLRRLLEEETLLEVAASPGEVWVIADPTAVEQVILNLCVNGRDAMPHGGTLTLGTSRIDAEAAQSRGMADVNPGGYGVLAVRDAGMGMDEATRAHLFEPFFTTKPKGKGNGLGLSTVKRIVDQSGGRILVASAPGQGSTFEAFFPRITA